MDIEQIARTCHEANRALCLAYGDTSQVAWEDAPDDIKASAIDGVRYTVDHPEATPEDSHSNWCAFKIGDGWVYGLVKDADKKTHPCLVAYAKLPAEQRAKDYVFQAIVGALTGGTHAARTAAETVAADAPSLALHLVGRALDARADALGRGQEARMCRTLATEAYRLRLAVVGAEYIESEGLE
jgi:hypothetical protein